MNAPLDHRLHAYRDDLADMRLRGQVEAERFEEGVPVQVVVPVSDMKQNPSADAGLLAQSLYGDRCRVLDERNGWSWIQREADGYVGYVASGDLTNALSDPTHLVLAQRTFLYPGPDLKFPYGAILSMGSRIRATGKSVTRGTHYTELDTGEFVIADHLVPLSGLGGDFVDIAEKFMHTPYLWGGDSGFGLDCSGLIALSMRMTGRTVLRDSDMQAESIGTILEPGTEYQNLQRGDLVFWKGHVGIMASENDLLHANGNTMNVALEPLAEAIERIGYLYGQPTLVRRP